MCAFVGWWMRKGGHTFKENRVVLGMVGRVGSSFFGGKECSVELKAT